jgi:putative Ig domain-containing protein
MGEVGLAYATVTLGAAGGVKPYKWSISSGALPPGVALSSTGKVTGNPTATGNYSFVVRVDDASKDAAGVPRTIFVFRQIAFTTSRANCSVSANPPVCTGPTLKYTGGASTTPKVSVTPNPGYPALPKGSTFTVKSGVVSYNIPGPACNTPNYDSIFTVVLIDQSPCVAGFRCTSGTVTLDIHMSNNC